MTEKKYDQDGKLHCDDGPAWIHPNGVVKYYKHGKQHRDDGPAEISTMMAGNLIMIWYKDDKQHRDDGPCLVAITKESGGFVFYILFKDHGVHHNKNGPAVINLKVQVEDDLKRGFDLYTEYLIDGKELRVVEDALLINMLQAKFEHNNNDIKLMIQVIQEALTYSKEGKFRYGFQLSQILEKFKELL